MLRACNTCNRRLRRKTVCVETKKIACRKCCEQHNEGCYYHHFCWSRLMS